MELHVHATAPGRGTLRWTGGVVACALGRAGVAVDKREGDGCTPAGSFALRRLLWRADRLGPAPESGLPNAQIMIDDGWCDAPGDSHYNRPVKLPYPASAEAMFRDDHLYDVVVILGHNDRPVVPGAGSAVFLHIAPPDGGPTAGCVALDEPALRAVLRSCDPTTRLVVHAG
jgi:L,D-peptidoglycan transpeptidase YkuD (ErfK/YbiS/YcfS/YnhG family)